MSERQYGRHRIELSNEDKIFFPDVGMTKGDLIGYYEKAADWLLPRLKDRPLTLQRFPDGVSGEGFYQKNKADYFPGWIDHVTLEKEDGENDYVICNKKATLLYLANQGCITPHVWLSRHDRPRHPDLLIFDLDPPDQDFSVVSFAAREIGKIMGDVGLTPFLMTTGSKGLHVWVPLDRTADFETTRQFGRAVADVLEKRHPEELTSAQRREKRRGRVFIDYLRNAYGQTAVCPYGVRALPGAPVATPLSWDELGRAGLTSQRYTTRNIFRRLGHKVDPWKGMHRHAADLHKALDELSSRFPK
ncbi:MAG: non-homologous end-joining DNA ligase [Bacteroidota bacterium]|nr:non-homologous end-joining DNA ligase [Bacteroidota bacterium]